MLSDGRGFFQQAPWMAIFPGLAIFVTVFAFNAVGDGLRDALDPQQRSVIEARGVGE
jgi:peptide/nickel transport system permease protein